MATFLIGFDILEDAFFWSAHILNFQEKIQVQKFMHVWMKFHGSAQKQGYNRKTDKGDIKNFSAS